MARRTWGSRSLLPRLWQETAGAELDLTTKSSDRWRDRGVCPLCTFPLGDGPACPTCRGFRASFGVSLTIMLDGQALEQVEAFE